MMKKRLLAVDYGEKRIGLAISDELNLFAYPLTVLINKPRVVSEIVKIVYDNKVGKIIVGLPVWDKSTTMVEKVKSFVELLKKELPEIEIEFVNEFYTTRIAEEKVVSIGKKLKKCKDKIDSYAACVILQEYLDTCYYDKK